MLTKEAKLETFPLLSVERRLENYGFFVKVRRISITLYKQTQNFTTYNKGQKIEFKLNLIFKIVLLWGKVKFH